MTFGLLVLPLRLQHHMMTHKIPGGDMNVWIDDGGSVGRKSVIGNVSVPHLRSKMVFSNLTWMDSLTPLSKQRVH